MIFSTGEINDKIKKNYTDIYINLYSFFLDLRTEKECL